MSELGGSAAVLCAGVKGGHHELAHSSQMFVSPQRRKAGEAQDR